MKNITSLDRLTYNPFLTSNKTNHTNSSPTGSFSTYFGGRKRAFDLVLTIAFLPLILLVIGVVALIIKLTTKGPIFFTQLRNGKDMVPFTIIKFQTYKENLETPVFGTNSGRENLTKIGRIMRKTSLDELPNFYNVLRGEMSLVGSRPHVVAEDAEIAKTQKNWNSRYDQLPGITGLAQASGEAGPMITPEHCADRLRLDVEYMSTASVMLDFKILIGTVFRGLYRRRS